MKKFNKLMLLLLIGGIVAPITASANVYFMHKNEENITRPAKVKPCFIRGYKIKESECKARNAETDGECTDEDGSKHFKRCKCDEEKYTKTPSTCSTYGQSPMGKSCKEAGMTEAKYEKCDCNRSSYPYETQADCPKDRQADGSYLATKMPSGGTCNNTQTGDTANGTTYYSSCSCDIGTYKKVCGFPFVGKGSSCDGKYSECICDPSKFNKECKEDGGKAKYGCTDPNTGKTMYSTCNSELPQVRITVLDGMFDGPDQTSCYSDNVTNGLDGAKVTFSKQGESDVIAYTTNGNLSIPAPFEVDDEKVTIAIEKNRNEKYDGTDQEERDYIRLVDTCVGGCDGNIYALSPKKFDDAVGQIRIIVTWGNMTWKGTDDAKYNIGDLDSHLLKSNSQYIYYPHSIRNGGSAVDGMTLDVDDTSCYGPETLTFPSSHLNWHSYYFSLLSYSTLNDATILQKSNAVVYVYVDGELKRIFRIKDAQKPGLGVMPSVWNVFKIYKQGNVTKIQSASTTSNHGKLSGVKFGWNGTNILRGYSENDNSNYRVTPINNFTGSRNAHGWSN